MVENHFYNKGILRCCEEYKGRAINYTQLGNRGGQKRFYQKKWTLGH